MTENSKITPYPEETTAKEPPLLPRSAWNSQLTHLKVLLKVKHTLEQKINKKSS